MVSVPLRFLLVFFRFLDVLLYIGVSQEIWWGIRNDFLQLWREDGVGQTAGQNHEDAWPQYIIIIRAYETGNELVVLVGQFLRLLAKFVHDFVVVRPVHNHLRLQVRQFGHASVKLGLPLNEARQRIVEGSACSRLLGFADTEPYLTFFEHYRHYAQVAKEDVCQHCGIHAAAKIEAAMHDSCRVYAFHLAIHIDLERQHFPFEVVHIRGPPYHVLAFAGY